MDTSPANTNNTESVRHTIATALSNLGCDTSDGLHETILIRRGVYCGRRFESAGGCAVWFIEENQIKLYAADGSLLSVCSPGEICAAATDSQRRAA
jgi:hypothetical protein